MQIGEQLKRQRESKHWSQQYLSDQLHISRQSISKWEQGLSLPSFANVVAISDLFDISLDDLIRGDEKLMKDLKIDQSFTAVEKIVWSSVGIAAVLFSVLLALHADFMQITPWLQVGGFIFLVALIFSIDWSKVNKALSKNSVILGTITAVLFLIPYLYNEMISFFEGVSGQ